MIKEPINYFLYARKSSESEDRQMASIDNQIQVVKTLAQKKGIHIVAVFQESKSAKGPGRPVFNEMMSRLEKGEAQGIICWKLNRLSRNPIDGGRISWLLQNKVIKHIQCNSSSYKPSDNVLMMSVELGMANQFIKDLSTDVKRGTCDKARRGWYPIPQPPLGYLHNKTSKKTVLKEEISPDPLRYPVVNKLWKLMLTGDYSLRKIKVIGDKMGLTTRKKRPLTLSGYNRLFKHRFYHGVFFWNNDQGDYVKYKGKHKAMISEAEFNRVQSILLSNKTSSTPAQYEFKYRGWLRCGECQSMITAERKRQVRCTGCKHKFSIIQNQTCPKCALHLDAMIQPNILEKIYYRCTKSKRCSQKYIEESELERQYIKLISKLEIPKGFEAFLLATLEEIQKEEHEASIKLKQSMETKKTNIEKRLESLVIMRADGEIEKASFVTSKAKFEHELSQLNEEIQALDYRNSRWREELKSYLNIGKQGVNILKSKDKKKLKRFMEKLSSNQTILAQSLCISSSKPLLALGSCKHVFTTEKESFEPKNPLVKQRDSSHLDMHCPLWWAKVSHLRDTLILH